MCCRECVCVLSVCHSSEEDDEEPLDWLPIAPEIEEPEDTGWGQLEVSEVHNTKTSFSCSQPLLYLVSL